MRFLWSAIGKIFFVITRIVQYCWRNFQRTQFKECGTDVWIGRNCCFTYQTISVGRDVYIGRGACFQSTHGKIEIGNHVMFGPEVHIHGGNHVINAVGVHIKSAPPKQAGSDGTVRICNDVWIGARAMILMGVTIGEGSIIGAGSIITKDVPPNTVIVGALPRKTWVRFDEDTLATHKDMLS